MTDELDALATAAAQQLVEAMARDTWELVKHQFVRVTQGRERRVDASRIALAQDSGINRERVRSTEVSAWRTRLRDSLDENPQLADVLRQIVATPPAGHAPSVVQSAGPSQSVQQATASGGSDLTQVFVPGAGNVRVNSPEHRHFRLTTPFAVTAHWTKAAVAGHPLVSATLALVIVVGGVAGTVLGIHRDAPTTGHDRSAGHGISAHAHKAVPSGGMVSITLSPARPAGVSALALAARLIRRRAGLLGLPSVQVDMAGSSVVVTGPLADEAQLKAIAVPGMLRFRPVLLDGPPAATASQSQGSVTGVNPAMLANFTSLNCRNPDWQLQLGFTPGARDPASSQIVSCAQDRSIKYVLDTAKVLGSDITHATALRPAQSTYWQVNVTFDGAGTKQFGTMTTSMYDHYGSNGNPRDQVAIVLDGVVISSPQIDRPITSGTALIPGISTQSAARQLAADLQTGALPVDFRITVIMTTATPS